MSIKAGLQQQLKDKHQQYTGRVTIVDSHQYQFVTNDTNDQPCLCDAIAYPSVVDKKKPPALDLVGAASSETKSDKLNW